MGMHPGPGSNPNTNGISQSLLNNGSVRDRDRENGSHGHGHGHGHGGLNNAQLLSQLNQTQSSVLSNNNNLALQMNGQSSQNQQNGKQALDKKRPYFIDETSNANGPSRANLEERHQVRCKYFPKCV